jgi:hypothetical protein
MSGPLARLRRPRPGARCRPRGTLEKTGRHDTTSTSKRDNAVSAWNRAPIAVCLGVLTSLL